MITSKYRIGTKRNYARPSLPSKFGKKKKYKSSSRRTPTVDYRSGVEFEESYSTVQPGTLTTHLVGAGLAQGAFYGQRIGNKVFIKGVKISGVVVNNNTDIRSGMFRLLVAENRRPAAADYVTGFFEPDADSNTPKDFGTGGEHKRIVRTLNQQKFHVLRDFAYQIRCQNASNPTGIYIKEYIPINRWITYNTSVTLKERLTPLFNIFFFVESSDNAAYTPTGIICDLQYRCLFRQ